MVNLVPFVPFSSLGYDTNRDLLLDLTLREAGRPTREKRGVSVLRGVGQGIQDAETVGESEKAREEHTMRGVRGREIGGW